MDDGELIKTGSDATTRHPGRTRMLRQSICISMLLLWGFAIQSPAVAMECGPLKAQASVDLVPQPNREMVPVAVNGLSRLFLLDTDGVATQISPKVVQALKLSIKTGATPLFDVSGNVSTAYAKIDTFGFGGMTGSGVYLRIAPNNLVDGILAPDVLKRSDVEMDFAGQKLNFFQPDHCPGKVVYWPHGDVAQISIVLADQKSIKVPVTLDGQSFLATIDTGANNTFINANMALASFGLAPGSPGVEPAGSVNNGLAVYAHTFSSLALDGVTIKNPRIFIMPDKVSGAAKEFGALPYLSGAVPAFAPKHVGLPELLLGMDVLKYLHLYFAFQEHNLYVTAGEPPSPGLATASRPTANAPVMQTAALPSASKSVRGQMASAAPGPQTQSNVCKLAGPPAPQPMGSGRVVSFVDRTTALALIETTQRKNGGLIDPDYVDNQRVNVMLGNGTVRLVLSPKTMQVHIGDTVNWQEGYRNPNLRCNYVPALITSDLGAQATAPPVQAPQQ
jgi:predicted aspartyl protease